VLDLAFDDLLGPLQVGVRRAELFQDLAGVGEGSSKDTPCTHVSDLAKEVHPPDKGILSRTRFSDDRLKAVLFGFAQGEELSEHTTSMPAVLLFLQREARLTLADDTLEARSGTWVHMPKGLWHSIQAQTPVGVLLLLKQGLPRARGSSGYLFISTTSICRGSSTTI
jgi:quercetin dioxygenase-like cupin family protein